MQKGAEDGKEDFTGTVYKKNEKDAYHSSAAERREIYRHMLRSFGEIEVRQEKKKMVGVTGEIYVKFSSLGNHHMEEFLEKQGCQCWMGGFLNYAIYMMDSERRCYLLEHPRPVMLRGYDAVLAYMKKK